MNRREFIFTGTLASIGLAASARNFSARNRHTIEQRAHDEHQDLIDSFRTDFGISIYNPATPISSTSLLQEYVRLGRLLPDQRTLGVDNEMTRFLVKDTVIAAHDGPLDPTVTLKQLILNTSFERADKYKTVIKPWDLPRLRFYHGVISAMPRHFIDLYAAGQKKPIELYLVDRRNAPTYDPFTIMPSLDYQRDDPRNGISLVEYNRVIGIYADDEGGKEKGWATPEWKASTVIHELTHHILRMRKTGGIDSLDTYSQHALELLGIRLNSAITNNSSIPQLHDPLLASGELITTYDEAGNKKSSSVTDTGYGGVNLGEFLPEAVDNYLFGREFFLKTYSRSYGETRARILHDFIKREFFGGYEFGPHEVLHKVDN